jgi:predicted kinase
MTLSHYTHTALLVLILDTTFTTMEMIIFTGIQASGKTTFFIEFFFNTHLRISLDLLNTRNKESIFLSTCLEIQQRIVIDNTNPTVDDRKIYIQRAKKYKYKVIGYFFDSNLDSALARNSLRKGKQNIREFGVKTTLKKLQEQHFSEGFDELYKVTIEDKFIITKIENEI